MLSMLTPVHLWLNQLNNGLPARNPRLAVPGWLVRSPDAGVHQLKPGLKAGQESLAPPEAAKRGLSLEAGSAKAVPVEP